MDKYNFFEKLITTGEPASRDELKEYAFSCCVYYLRIRIVYEGRRDDPDWIFQQRIAEDWRSLLDDASPAPEALEDLQSRLAERWSWEYGGTMWTEMAPRIEDWLRQNGCSGLGEIPWGLSALSARRSRFSGNSSEESG